MAVDRRSLAASVTVNLDTEPYLDPKAYRGRHLPSHRRSAFIDDALAVLAACENPRALNLPQMEELEAMEAYVRGIGRRRPPLPVRVARRGVPRPLRRQVSLLRQHLRGGDPCAATTLRVLRAHNVAVHMADKFRLQLQGPALTEPGLELDVPHCYSYAPSYKKAASGDIYS
uniref:Uncharacterized protein n=1 Tax=Leersia perrieri TaxID=77586 RepID=A0A0D9WRJ5_9ORYZ